MRLVTSRAARDCVSPGPPQVHGKLKLTRLLTCHLVSYFFCCARYKYYLYDVAEGVIIGHLGRPCLSPGQWQVMRRSAGTISSSHLAISRIIGSRQRPRMSFNKIQEEHKKKERSQREKCQNSQPVTAATNGTADNCYATCNLVAAAHPQLMVRRVEFEFSFFLLLPPFRPASGEEFSRVDTRR